MLYIHPDECIDCGACEAACPVSAIYYSYDLTPTLSRSSTSTPGSSTRSARRPARDLGQPGRDPEFVASLPPGGRP